jgi:DNA helicase II / ATP-dependent DNA helicase PcrA
VPQGEFSFEPGVDVTDAVDAKGLEFDYVVVPDASEEVYPKTEEARRRLHVAVTRTSHQLWLVSSGRRSPLLPADGAACPGLARLQGHQRRCPGRDET